jgi:hypothetical protein
MNLFSGNDVLKKASNEEIKVENWFEIINYKCLNDIKIVLKR